MATAFDLAALDLAGTTIQEHGAVYVALRSAVVDRLGAEIDDQVFHRWTGTSKRAAVAGLLREAGVEDPTTADAVYDDLRGRLMDRYAEVPPTPLRGVPEAITSLRENGVAVVLQTGYDRDVAEAVLAGIPWKVGEHIDGLVTSDEVAASRPAPYLIFRAMELSGARSVARVLVAGDTPNDLGAGVNAGAGFVVGVLSGAGRAAELSALPHTHLLESVADLPGLV